MTRLEQELSGKLGAFWKQNAEQEIEKISQKALDGEIFFGADGVCRWKSNNRVLPAHCRELLTHSPYRDLFDEQACNEAESEETARAIAAYKENHRTTEEEKAEMRAAFGTGTTVVDIITGERVAL